MLAYRIKSQQNPLQFDRKRKKVEHFSLLCNRNVSGQFKVFYKRRNILFNLLKDFWQETAYGHV